MPLKANTKRLKEYTKGLKIWYKILLCDWMQLIISESLDRKKWIHVWNYIEIFSNEKKLLFYVLKDNLKYNPILWSDREEKRENIKLYILLMGWDLNVWYDV